MQPHILTIPDDESYQKLVKLAEVIGLHIGADGLVSKQEESAGLPAVRSMLSEVERRQHLAIIARGGSGKSIPDPAAWQRELRQDRPLPGRD